MHTVIINGSPRSNTTSNTKNIINSFLKGYIKKGNTYEIYNIADNTQWEKARKAFYSSENIIIATPLFAESLPGILIAFLESLAINPDDKNSPLTVDLLITFVKTEFIELTNNPEVTSS